MAERSFMSASKEDYDGFIYHSALAERKDVFTVPSIANSFYHSLILQLLKTHICRGALQAECTYQTCRLSKKSGLI
ncbi:MAG: hypothetical protein Q4D64_11005 [Prevotellaceae bacterium]|nr:hypothetical protein [Prevotellaceae bacterium]